MPCINDTYARNCPASCCILASRLAIVARSISEPRSSLWSRSRSFGSSSCLSSSISRCRLTCNRDPQSLRSADSCCSDCSCWTALSRSGMTRSSIERSISVSAHCRSCSCSEVAGSGSDSPVMMQGEKKERTLETKSA